MGPKLEKLSFFQGNQGQLFQFCPGRIETLFLHIPDPDYPSFYLKCPRKYQKPYNFEIFFTLPKFAPLLLPNFGKHSKFDYNPYVYIIEV